MGNIVKVHVQLWSDEKFKGLSAPPPNAQTLWLYLLTGPHHTQVPGLFIAGPAAMAEALGWEAKAFQKAFLEVIQKGLAKYQEQTRLVWLPNAPTYNPPQATKVVVSWRYGFDALPDCPLRTIAFQHFKVFLEAFGKPFREPFKIPLGKPFGKPSYLLSTLKSSSKSGMKTLFSDDFSLTPERIKVAIEYDIPEAWVNHVWHEWETAAKANGFTYLDWDAAWRNNCVRAAGRKDWLKMGRGVMTPVLSCKEQIKRSGVYGTFACGRPTQPGQEKCAECRAAKKHPDGYVYREATA